MLGNVAGVNELAPNVGLRGWAHAQDVPVCSETGNLRGLLVGWISLEPAGSWTGWWLRGARPLPLMSKVSLPADGARSRVPDQCLRTATCVTWPIVLRGTALVSGDVCRAWM